MNLHNNTYIYIYNNMNTNNDSTDKISVTGTQLNLNGRTDINE